MLNLITIHGYLGKKPELREIQGTNGPFARVDFSVAVSRNRGDETDWFRCVMYGERARVLEKYFTKGQEILLSGRMESFKSNRDDSRTLWNIIVSDFNFCGKKDSGTHVNEDPPKGFVSISDDDALVDASDDDFNLF